MRRRAKSELGKDAGSARTRSGRSVRARPRTQPSDALQPVGHKTTSGAGH
jgi:hypothetical protein